MRKTKAGQKNDQPAERGKLENQNKNSSFVECIPKLYAVRLGCFDPLEKSNVFWYPTVSLSLKIACVRLECLCLRALPVIVVRIAFA